MMCRCVLCPSATLCFSISTRRKNMRRLERRWHRPQHRHGCKMRAVSYTQNLRDLLWVQPIWQETSGTFCSELSETARHVHDFDATLPFELLPTPDKLTIGGAAGSGRISLNRTTPRVPWGG